MLNGLFVLVALVSILTAAFTGGMEALTDSVLSSARNAIELAFGLIGVLAFFLGLMRVLSDSGLMASLARVVSPVMKLLFPSIPAASPAMSAMILNIAGLYPMESVNVIAYCLSCELYPTRRPMCILCQVNSIIRIRIIRFSSTLKDAEQIDCFHVVFTKLV